jgi:prepilin-type N-terminal cleavage/methylation domain-containing protein
MTARRHRRSAFTIVEMMVVIAVVLILGAILIPSLVGFWSNNRTKAGVDIATARLSDARGAAISRGQAYRVCASPDGRQIRVCPDESELAEQLPTDSDAPPLVRTDTLPDGVVLTPILTGTADATASADGWVTLVTFLPDGTCREDASEFQLAEPDVTPQVVRVRGLTGVWTVNPATATNTMSGGRP